jgi:hypothetical protein
MTLIASFCIEGFPFVLGDLLISGRKGVRQRVHVPSIGDVAGLFPSGSATVPAGLRRKVCQFSNVCVAWAGSYPAAKRMITRMFNETQKSGPMTRDTLDRLLFEPDEKGHKALRHGDVALLGYVIDPGDGESFAFGDNYSHTTSSILGNLRVAGSGRRLFETYLDHQGATGLQVCSSQMTGSFEEAVCRALTVVGMLLQLELGTRRTLIQHFGGGYELVAQQHNRFLLPDDLMYAFWFADLDDTGVTITPVMKFFKQTYWGDILVIRTLEMNAPVPGNPVFLTKRTDEVHYFRPIYRGMAAGEMAAVPTPDLQAFMLCSYVLVRSRHGLEVLAKFDWSKNRRIPVRFNDDGTTMAVEVQSKYVEDVLTAIETRR